MKNQLFFLFIACLLSCAKPQKKLEYGAISAASPEATKAGLAILKKGGNAVDAAIAVSFALGVSEPAMSGVGGGTQVLIHFPDQQAPFTINGSTISPSLTPTSFEKDSLKGHLRTTIPSTVKVMQYLYENYASKKLSWEALIEPAIEIAEKGFEMGPFRTKVYQLNEKKLMEGLPSTSEYHPISPPKATVQNKITNLLRLLAKDGAATFYEGSIAKSFAQDMQINGGWITEEDLANFPNPEILPSVHFKHNGFDIYTQPEPCGGWVIKEMLEKLSALRATENRNDLELLVESIHYGHEKRKIKAEEQITITSGETTHFSVMDANGLALSVTASINAYYGAGVANPDYGFLYNSYMDDFNFKKANNKYAIGPNKMAYSSMSPTIVMKDDKIVLIIGSPGSARIISTVAQLIDAYTKNKVKPAQLLQVPRIHAINKKAYFESEEQKTQFNRGKKGDWKIVKPSQKLVQNGLNAYFGGVHAIVWTGEEYVALADPRRDGFAMVE